MKEMTGDLWGLAETHPGSVVVVTTNGSITKDGRLVMGRGCAREARDRYKGLDLKLGKQVKKEGNVALLHRLSVPTGEYPQWLFTFPVKHYWRDTADIVLIINSARQIEEMIRLWSPHRTVFMPRPGCGNGKLDWGFVKPFLDEILPDNFIAVTKLGIP